MSAPVGSRVAALLSAKDGVAQFLGDGTYLGDKLCPVGPFGIPLEDMKKIYEEMGFPYVPYRNPCIQLDNGRYVWGFQCWWGPAENFHARYADWTLEPVEIESLEPLEEVDQSS